jgi:hypothetical protein
MILNDEHDTTVEKVGGGGAISRFSLSVPNPKFELDRLVRRLHLLEPVQSCNEVLAGDAVHATYR